MLLWSDNQGCLILDKLLNGALKFYFGKIKEDPPSWNQYAESFLIAIFQELVTITFPWKDRAVMSLELIFVSCCKNLFVGDQMGQLGTERRACYRYTSRQQFAFRQNESLRGQDKCCWGARVCCGENWNARGRFIVRSVVVEIILEHPVVILFGTNYQISWRQYIYIYHTWKKVGIQRRKNVNNDAWIPLKKNANIFRVLRVRYYILLFGLVWFG